VPAVNTVEVSEGHDRRGEATADPLQVAEKHHVIVQRAADGARALLAERLQLLPALLRFL